VWHTEKLLIVYKDNLREILNSSNQVAWWQGMLEVTLHNWQELYTSWNLVVLGLMYNQKVVWSPELESLSKGIKHICRAALLVGTRDLGNLFLSRVFECLCDELRVDFSLKMHYFRCSCAQCSHCRFLENSVPSTLHWAFYHKDRVVCVNDSGKLHSLQKWTWVFMKLNNFLCHSDILLGDLTATAVFRIIHYRHMFIMNLHEDCAYS